MTSPTLIVRTDIDPQSPGEPWPREVLPLTALRVNREHMEAVLAAYERGETSQTPNAALWVRVVDDAHPDRHPHPVYEVVDGHHRLASAIGHGDTGVVVDIDDVPDDEPLVGPFYDFSVHMG